MGQFLATGLVTKMSVSKQKMEKGKITLDEIREKLENNFHYDLSIFDEKEEDEYIVWSLNNKLMEKELIPFLKKFLYKINYYTQNTDNVIRELENNTADKWLEIAENRSLEYFQIDEYGEDEYIYFANKDFRPSIKINSTSIMFSAEGKIIMEEYGTQFNFYKYCMVQTYKEFKIASALRIYITG